MLTIEDAIEWEQLTGKRLQDFDGASEDDMIALGYIQHPEHRSYTLTEYTDALTTAPNLKELERVARKATLEFRYIAQFRRKAVEAGEASSESITDMAGQLITSGIDGNFLLKRGIEDLHWISKAAQQHQQHTLENARFWAYLQLSPYLDKDKVKNAKEFLPFEWEAPLERDTITELEKKMAEALFKD